MGGLERTRGVPRGETARAREGGESSRAAPFVRYCLDAWAIIEWMEGGQPAAGRVESVLPQRPLMSWINLGEVAYRAERREGKEGAAEVIDTLRNRLTLDLPSERLCLAAFSLKAAHSISYGDSFAVATAMFYDAVLLTGDPEILGADPLWPVESLL